MAFINFEIKNKHRKHRSVLKPLNAFHVIKNVDINNTHYVYINYVFFKFE